MQKISKKIILKAQKIRLLLTDCDGVLTDSGVYYSTHGEQIKKFSVRDGMGVERLRKLVNIETGIITGENSEVVLHRAEKLQIKEYHPGIKDKYLKLKEILTTRKLKEEEVAFIGDDINDLEIMTRVGLSACPADAMSLLLKTANIVVENKGGCGAFRDFAEILIECQKK